MSTVGAWTLLLDNNNLQLIDENGIIAEQYSNVSLHVLTFLGRLQNGDLIKFQRGG